MDIYKSILENYNISNKKQKHVLVNMLIIFQNNTFQEKRIIMVMI